VYSTKERLKLTGIDSEGIKESILVPDLEESMRTNLLISVCLLTLFMRSFSAEPGLLWNSGFSSAGESVVWDSIILPSGACVAVGDVAFGQSENRRINICELNKDGLVLWEQTALSLGNASGYSILSIPEGYAVCGDRVDSSGTSGLILKTDLNGNTVWSRVISYEGDDSLQDMCLTPDGNIIAVGYSLNSETSDNDVLAVCFSDSGSVLWQKRYVSPDYQAAYSIVQSTDSPGSYVVTGSDGGDVFLMKVNGLGDWQWKTRHFIEGIQMGRSVSGLSDGGYVVAGSTRGEWGFSDAILVFFDSDGTVTNDLVWGGDGPDNAYSVSEVQPAGYVVLVNSNSGRGEGYRPFLVRFDPWLSTIWSVQLTELNALCYSMFINDDEGFTVTGKTSTPEDNTHFSAFLIRLSSEDLLNWN